MSIKTFKPQKLTLIEKDVARSLSKTHYIYDYFQCECGNKKVVARHKFLNKHTTTCGCSNHGMEHTKEYRAWINMKSRCLNTNNASYPRYGGRGITFCKSWESFISFFKDMGYAPSKEYSIDRIDVNGNYEPSNCKWSTSLEQCNNKTTNTPVGPYRSISEASRATGISESTISWRIENCPEKVLYEGDLRND